MATRYDPMMVPDVEHAIPIEDEITALRKDVEERCALILRRVKVFGEKSQGRETLKLRSIEKKAIRIRQARFESFGIEELHELVRESEGILLEVEKLSKGSV